MSDVPPLPPIPSDLLARHSAAHRGLAEALAEAAVAVQAVFRFSQYRLVLESLANVQPTRAGGDPLLFPAPRTFLSQRLQRRMTASAVALRHVDARVTMVRDGLVDRIVLHSTPVALHALFEASNPASRETNPGMLRATPTGWIPEVNPFVHAPGPECEALVAAAIDVANGAPAPAVARAAWLTFTMLSIHPFVDGNGRTSRMLFHAIAAEELSLGFDWGIAEQWSLQREAYVAALQEGQRVGEYDPDRLNAEPFILFSTEASTFGAQLCAERLRLLVQEHAQLVDKGLGTEAAAVLMAVRLQRIATLQELERLGFDDRLSAGVDALLDAGFLRWAPRHAGWRTIEHPDPLGLVVVD